MEPKGPPDSRQALGEGFTRRVCAVLLADVTGFSALMGEDDERTARAVRSLQTLVQGIAAECNGHAEGFAGDAIFASFDSVVAAVDAALKIQRRVATEEFAGTHLQMRIGVHSGDVLIREGAAFGDAINVAARLQTLAKPGTVCISESIYRQVRNKFDERFVDLGRQHLKNISDPVHAYLIVPREFAEVHAPRRSRAAWAIGGAVLVVAGGLAVVAGQRYWRTPPAGTTEPPATSAQQPQRAAAPGPIAAAAPQETQRVTLGVMLFKSLGGDGENDWRRDALRDGLNAQLSQLSQVKVYSKEFIDFLMSRKGLTDIEAATQLGIQKMLSGSFVVVGGTLQVETHVVDVPTGVLEASYTTSGPEADFLDLQNRVTWGVISRLNLPITAEEKRTLLARTSTNVEALKMLLEAEGGAKTKPAEPPSGRSMQAPRSELVPWLAWPARALAAVGEGTDGDAQQAIVAVLEQYRRATESREVEALAAIYDEFSPEQQAAQQRYFENVRDLRVAIDNIDVAIVGDEAVASYTRTDDFIDARTGRPMHVTVRLTKILRRADGTWKLTGAQ